MSRDLRGNGIQEVVGSIPISSTKSIKDLHRSEKVGFVVLAVQSGTYPGASHDLVECCYQ